MNDHEQMIDLLRTGDKRREERRRFMRTAASATIAAGGLSLLAACGDDGANVVTPTPTPTPTPAAGAATVHRAMDHAAHCTIRRAAFT
jgi:hypothetical protein